MKDSNTKNPAAVALGKMTSEAKAAAARVNGKKGGRPRTHDGLHCESEGCRNVRYNTAYRINGEPVELCKKHFAMRMARLTRREN